ncbi:MAG: 4-(cytidine 5'-diphospho)-2-C-methyl-D-erythritol kinase [Candidatus Firestonebacteria bacterium]
MVKIILKSFAKVNLFLEVLNKRNDGYHNIRTVYQTINLADDICLEKLDKKIIIKCDNAKVPSGNKNIVYKAVRKILNYKGITSGVKIVIRKRIPVASGLGGGSSNAAVVLNGMNKLYGLNLSFQELSKIAEALGCDVPFFLKGGTALGEGRGEILTYLTPIKNLYFVLVKDGHKSSTKKVYENFKIKLTKGNIFDKRIRRFLKGGDVLKILHNDLEDAAGDISSKVAEIKSRLRGCGSSGSLMSGSGPTVFGLSSTKQDAYKIYDKIKNEYDWVCISKSIRG